MAFFCPQKKTPSPSELQPVPKRPLPTPPEEFNFPQRLHPVLNPSFDALVSCRICCSPHRPYVPCTSRPPVHPDQVHPACDICNGHHPLGFCYYDYLRPHLLKPSPCARCNGLIHQGFCKGSLLCKHCGLRHNGKFCSRDIRDLSNNFCPNCKQIHTLHCTRDLANLNISISLYCNRCKIEHPFMKCTPFCNKCFRHHTESPTCPQDFCTFCSVSHSGQPCTRQPSLQPISPEAPAPTTTTTTVPLPLTSLEQIVNNARAFRKPRSPPPLRQIKKVPKRKATPIPEPSGREALPSSRSKSSSPIIDPVYICPDSCECDSCKAVDFIESSSRLTPLPTFTERLI